MQLYSLLMFQFLCFLLVEAQQNFTFDEFFNSSYFPSLSLSPNGQYVIVHRRRPEWESNSYENSLWLYETQGQGKTLITRKLSEVIKPTWSPSGNWIALLVDESAAQHTPDDRSKNTDHRLHLYSILTNELLSVSIGNQLPTAIAWSHNDSSLYFTTVATQSVDEEGDLNETEWKDVIRYRRRKPSDNSMIYQIEIRQRNRQISGTVNTIAFVNFSIGELLFVPSEQKLVFASRANGFEDLALLELYSIELRNISALVRLTHYEGIEQNLQLSPDGKSVLFHVYPLTSNSGEFEHTQQRLYSVDLTNGQVERYAKDFDGNIVGYAVRSEGGVYILGQLGINVQIYIQESPSDCTILQSGWDGSYEKVSSSSSKERSSTAFLHSSFERPEELYFAARTDQLESAKMITNENQLFTQRNLPKAKVFQWVNGDDHRTIEGILHYPPGKYEQRNLPLFVFIHGGPADASLNLFHANWLTWAPMAATEGWLVFEPNYRGSIGYGDDFVSEIRFELLTRPGRDILAGVDRLVTDGIADPNRLTIGGFSYGGYLTNWLITQTTRFNAAVSGAGAVDQGSSWGRTDMPSYQSGLIGGNPWEIPQRYLNESAIYHLGNVCTPTHIVSGANDIRVPIEQSYILERGLYYLGVPGQLLLFPNEAHSLRGNPWHGKIKVREELKWLHKHGHTRCSR